MGEDNIEDLKTENRRLNDVITMQSNSLDDAKKENATLKAKLELREKESQKLLKKCSEVTAEAAKLAVKKTELSGQVDVLQKIIERNIQANSNTKTADDSEKKKDGGFKSRKYQGKYYKERKDDSEDYDRYRKSYYQPRPYENKPYQPNYSRSFRHEHKPMYSDSFQQNAINNYDDNTRLKEHARLAVEEVATSILQNKNCNHSKEDKAECSHFRS